MNQAEEGKIGHQQWLVDIVLGVDMRKKVRTMGSRKDERISMADFKIDAKKPDLELSLIHI